MRQNKSIVVVISHRPSALSALDMTMVLYEGKAIAFGPSAEVFARVRNAGGKVPGSPQPPPQAKAEPRASIAESVSS
jgi:ABC-type protease/lipase transport system fused ATPase/permease subunit